MIIRLLIIIMHVQRQIKFSDSCETVNCINKCDARTTKMGYYRLCVTCAKPSRSIQQSTQLLQSFQQPRQPIQQSTQLSQSFQQPRQSFQQPRQPIQVVIAYSRCGYCHVKPCMKNGGGKFLGCCASTDCIILNTNLNALKNPHCSIISCNNYCAEYSLSNSDCKLYYPICSFHLLRT